MKKDFKIKELQYENEKLRAEYYKDCLDVRILNITLLK